MGPPSFWPHALNSPQDSRATGGGLDDEVEVAARVRSWLVRALDDLEALSLLDLGRSPDDHRKVSRWRARLEALVLGARDALEV